MSYSEACARQRRRSISCQSRRIENDLVHGDYRDVYCRRIKKDRLITLYRGHRRLGTRFDSIE